MSYSRKLTPCLPSSQEDIMRNIIAILAINGEKGLVSSEIEKEYHALLNCDIPWRDFKCSNLDDLLKRYPQRIKCVSSQLGSGNRYLLTEQSESLFSRVALHSWNTSRPGFKFGSASTKLQTKSNLGFVPAHIRSNLTKSYCSTKSNLGFVPAHIRGKINNLIIQWPNGIKLDQFLEIYCETYGVDLVPESCMCRSVEEIFVQLGEIISVHPGEACLLYPTESVVQTNKEEWRKVSTSLSIGTIRSNLRILLAQRGLIALNCLQQCYYSMHKTYINLHQLGYVSLTELLDKNQDLFVILKGNNGALSVALSK